MIFVDILKHLILVQIKSRVLLIKIKSSLSDSSLKLFLVIIIKFRYYYYNFYNMLVICNTIDFIPEKQIDNFFTINIVKLNIY